MLPKDPSAVAIRLYRSSDFAALASLMRETWVVAFGEGMDAADVAAHLAGRLSDGAIASYVASDAFLVAEAGDGLVGLVEIGIPPEGVAAALPGDVEVRRLYVLAGWQGLGIGTRLLAAALTHPRVEQASRTLIEVWEANKGAQRLYRRFGFRQRIGLVPYVVDGRVLGHDLLLARSNRELA